MRYFHDSLDISYYQMAFREASVPIPEGLLFASLDALSLDYCCARYCFNQLPMMTGKELMKENHWPTEFVQKVPVPYLDGTLALVLWENNTIPILGGREYSGMPKIYADITDMNIDQGTYFSAVSFHGNTFLEFNVTNLTPCAQ